MIERKKKIYLIQILLLITGLITLFYTYKNSHTPNVNQIVSEEKKIEIKDRTKNESDDVDVFFNIKYSGIDLAGNRYILKAEKAVSDKLNKEVIKMNNVNAVFYFKDDSVLNVKSEKGIYNNRTLDITFTKNVFADYGESKLFAQKAEYFNSKNYIEISENVRVKSDEGKLYAEKLFLDIKEETLNISSSNDEKVNAVINLK